MLKLEDFKKIAITNDQLVNEIKGGISCERFWDVMAYLDEHNPAQAKAIRDTYEPSGWQNFQCS